MQEAEKAGWKMKLNQCIACMPAICIFWHILYISICYCPQTCQCLSNLHASQVPLSLLHVHPFGPYLLRNVSEIEVQTIEQSFESCVLFQNIICIDAQIEATFLSLVSPSILCIVFDCSLLERLNYSSDWYTPCLSFT